jgi:hypothetical protein
MTFTAAAAAAAAAFGRTIGDLLDYSDTADIARLKEHGKLLQVRVDRCHCGSGI